MQGNRQTAGFLTEALKGLSRMRGNSLVRFLEALPSRGKRGGARMLLVYCVVTRAFLVYGYAKNQRDNSDDRELRTLKLLADRLLELTDAALNQEALQHGELKEVTTDG